jgi:hypothetical protein
MIPGTYHMHSILRGDSWRGLPSIVVRVNGSPPASALASARMQFRQLPVSPSVGHELSTAAGSITITSAANWELSIPAQELPLGARLWYWDLETTDAAGTVRTYLKGTLEIQQDVSR